MVGDWWGGTNEFVIHPPFLDFDAIEDRISDHLPSSFTRHSLGFSPVAFLFYSIMFIVFLAVIFRLRHRFRSSLRWYMYKRDRNYISENFSMEEGRSFSNIPRLSSSWSSTVPRASSPLFQPFRTLSFSKGSRLVRPLALDMKGYEMSNGAGQYSPTRGSPLRSFSFPVTKAQTGFSAMEAINGAATAFVPGSPRLSDGNIVSNGSLSSLTSRSRNSSQMNLSSLTPRQMTSRTSSGSHTPIGSLFQEE